MRQTESKARYCLFEEVFPWHTIPPLPRRAWHDSAHASLCLLGSYLRQIGFFQPLEERVQIQQKVLKYTSVQKLEMFFVALLAGAKAVSQTNLSVRIDPALYHAFGLPGCAEQSGIAHTLDAATEADVSALRAALAETFGRYSQACRHDWTREPLLLDLDLSPLPTSRHAEGATRGYMGRCRSKTGRKLVRVRAAASQETVWETVVAGNTVETLAVLQEAVTEAERLLGLSGEEEAAQAKRACTEIRLDGGWGTEANITWLLERSYQATGKFKSTSRVRKLVRGITKEQPTSSPGRDLAPVPMPVRFRRPLAQYAVRTPSKKYKDGYYYAVVFSTRLDRPMTEVVGRYHGRAGVEADLKSDKRGLAAQKLVVLLTQLAHNVLIWARGWLAAQAPRLRECGIVRLVQEVWAVPGRVKLVDKHLERVRLRHEHPRARDISYGFRPLLASSQILGFW